MNFTMGASANSVTLNALLSSACNAASQHKVFGVHSGYKGFLGSTRCFTVVGVELPPQVFHGLVGGGWAVPQT